MTQMNMMDLMLIYNHLNLTFVMKAISRCIKIYLDTNELEFNHFTQHERTIILLKIHFNINIVANALLVMYPSITNRHTPRTKVLKNLNAHFVINVLAKSGL